MALPAVNSLQAWTTAFNTGDVTDLASMLADDFVFHNTQDIQETKGDVVQGAGAGGFSCNKLVVTTKITMSYAAITPLK